MLSLTDSRLSLGAAPAQRAGSSKVSLGKTNSSQVTFAPYLLSLDARLRPQATYRLNACSSYLIATNLTMGSDGTKLRTVFGRRRVLDVCTVSRVLIQHGPFYFRPRSTGTARACLEVDVDRGASSQISYTSIAKKRVQDAKSGSVTDVVEKASPSLVLSAKP